MNKITNSLHTEFAKTLLKPFYRAIDEYRLINAGDSIAVCISGGKDSMLMAALFSELTERGAIPCEVRYLAMDPGYTTENRALLEKNLSLMGIKADIFSTNIFRSVEGTGGSPCFLCSKIRRGTLYAKAKELGCTKIALGHHYNDVIESILMGMIYGGQVQTMLPVVRAKNFDNMALIRPMYHIRESEIERFRDRSGLTFLPCACRLSRDSQKPSKRGEMKQLIARLKAENPQIEANIFRSVQNVDLSRIMSYKDKTGTHSFLDEFE